MISYGDMLDTIEKIEPQNHPSVAEKKGGSEPEKKYSEPEKKDGEPENEVDESEDVI